MRLVVVLDSVGYDTFVRAKIPSLRVGEIHRALSHGSWTLPSFASMLVGVFPACTVPGCHHRRLIKPDVFLCRKRRVAVVTSNPWVAMLARGMGAGVVEVVRETARVRELPDADLVFLHVMETHFVGDEEWTEEVQLERLEEAAESLAPLIDSVEDVLVTADHGENFGSGERHGNFDGVFRREIFEVPLVTRGEWPGW